MNQYTTEFRQLDSRLGRWFSVDPVFQPHQSPYNSMDGNPINLTDVLGLSTDSEKSSTNDNLEVEESSESGGFFGWIGSTVNKIKNWFGTNKKAEEDNLSHEEVVEQVHSQAPENGFIDEHGNIFETTEDGEIIFQGKVTEPFWTAYTTGAKVPRSILKNGRLALAGGGAGGYAQKYVENIFENPFMDFYETMSKWGQEHVVIELSGKADVGVQGGVKASVYGAKANAELNLVSWELAEFTYNFRKDGFLGSHIFDGEGGVKIRQSVGADVKLPIAPVKIGLRVEREFVTKPSGRGIMKGSDIISYTPIIKLGTSKSIPTGKNGPSVKTGSVKMQSDIDKTCYCIDFGAGAKLILGLDLNLKMGLEY